MSRRHEEKVVTIQPSDPDEKLARKRNKKTLMTSDELGEAILFLVFKKGRNLSQNGAIMGLSKALIGYCTTAGVKCSVDLKWPKPIKGAQSRK